MIRVLLLAPSHEIVGGQTVQGERLMKLLGAVCGLDMRFQASNPLFPVWLRWAKRVPVFRTLVSMALFVPILLWKSRRVDMLHVFTAGIWHFTLWTIPAILIAKVYGKKTIINYRDGQCEEHLRTFSTAKPTLLMADAVVVPSGFLVDVLKRYGIAARSIFNVIDSSHFVDRERAALRPAFLSNRGLEPLYNIECILRAFQRIQVQYPDASLMVAHDGPSRKGLESMAASLGLRHCRFIGRVKPEDMPGIYDQVDIYLNTPNIDNMPGTLLECMASGLPIVSTKAGGIPYIVRDEETALLVEVNDDAGVAAAAVRLLRDPDLVRRITAAGRREVQRYAGPPIRDAWVDLYQTLMQSSPR